MVLKEVVREQWESSSKLPLPSPGTLRAVLCVPRGKHTGTLVSGLARATHSTRDSGSLPGGDMDTREKEHGLTEGVGGSREKMPCSSTES